jgi:L-lactate utilization protein LutB
MFNLPDMTKLAQAAKEVQDKQQRAEEKKMELLSRIEQKLDRILEELKKKGVA